MVRIDRSSGASILECRIRDWRRRSVFRSYLDGFIGRPNLAINTFARADCLVVEGDRAVGVEILHRGMRTRVRARAEIVLSLWTIATPKLLIPSGGGGEKHTLERVGIAVRHRLSRVGQNYQDHVAPDVVWALPELIDPRNSMAEAMVCARSDPTSSLPDIEAVPVEVPLASEVDAQRYELRRQVGA